MSVNMDLREHLSNITVFMICFKPPSRTDRSKKKKKQKKKKKPPSHRLLAATGNFLGKKLSTTHKTNVPTEFTVSTVFHV